MTRRFRASSMCLVFAFLVGAGCGPSLPPMAPVKGKVTVDGQPVTAGQVTYTPTEDTKGAGLSAGTINAQGEYTISTGGQSGAPLGKYKVTVTPSMVPTPGATSMPKADFNAQYQNAQSTPLTIEVVKDPKEGQYDLKLTK